MTSANQDQADYWGSDAGRKWVDNEALLDTTLRPVLDRLIEKAGLTRGDAVLDIGCGTGASALAAARAVGDSGSVQGADISTPLLDRARVRAASQARANVTFHQCDAQSEPFEPAIFDAMISRFGVMFFADPVAAFSNIARALKPGARLTFASWGPLSENPWFRVPHIAAAARLGQPPKFDRNAPGPLAFHDTVRVSDLLRQAGLVDVRAEPEDCPLTPPGDLGDFADMALRIGPAARLMTLFDGTPQDAKAIAAEIVTQIQSFETANGTRVPALINFYRARVRF